MADFSRQRQRKALAMLRAPEFKDVPLDYQARLMYAVGLLIADRDTGAFKQTALQEAWRDPSVRQAARNLLRRSGFREEVA